MSNAVADVPLAKCTTVTPAEACQIEWDFAGTPQAYFWVEKWDAAELAWISVHDRASNDVTGRHESPVSPGHLYRVRGCKENEVTRSHGCVGSTAFWVPVWPRSEAEIPETVDVHHWNGEVETFQVSKNLHLVSQTAQYNIYLMIKELALAGKVNLPPMQEPPSVQGVPSTPLEIVEANVYLSYAKLRTGYLDDPARWKPDPATRPEK